MRRQAHDAERLDAAVDGKVAAYFGVHVNIRAHHLVVGVFGAHRARRVLHTPERRLAAHHSACARAERLNVEVNSPNASNYYRNKYKCVV